MQHPEELRDSAIRDALESSQQAGVKIRPLRRAEEMVGVSQLFAEIWQLKDSREPVDRDLLVAMAHAGNYVVGAFDGERLVGACVGFFGEPHRRTLHSHITGVVADLAGRGVGTAIKQHQRAWCLEREISQITWTYDPLIARNASFNLRRLGVQVEEYLVEFYGPMDDGRNRGQPSDRLWVVWDLANPHRRAVAGEPAREPLPGSVLSMAPDGSPMPSDIPVGVAQVGVGIPSDVETLRLSDPALAQQWRYAVRDAMTTLLDLGWTIMGFDRSGSTYVFERVREY